MLCPAPFAVLSSLERDAQAMQGLSLEGTETLSTAAPFVTAAVLGGTGGTESLQRRQGTAWRWKRSLVWFIGLL